MDSDFRNSKISIFKFRILDDKRWRVQMPTVYRVRQGECITNISIKHGFIPETLWNDPANAQLKENRRNHNILYPGDQVTIPELRLKEEQGGTGSRHRFRRKGMPVYLQLQLRKDNGDPLANERFVLRVEGQIREGTTDEEGRLREPIPPQAMAGVLTIRNRDFKIRIGHLNPAEYNSGIRSRLNNLGYSAGAGGEELNSDLRHGIEAFQETQGLSKTGQIDEAMRSTLMASHKH